VPTKTLREAALYFSGLAEGGFYGLRTAAPAEVAIDIIRNRTSEVRGVLQRETVENIARSHVDYIEGEASLDPDGTVRVAGSDGGEHRLRAKAILMATGSRPHRPKNISFDIPGVCDTDTILYRGRPPREILIVAGGPIGVEFATVCHTLGPKGRDCRSEYPADPSNGRGTLQLDGRAVPQLGCDRVFRLHC